MPAYNFKREFAEDVRSGRKRQTIRARRKDGREPKVGETLFLYTGMRTKKCERLRVETCSSVFRIRIEEDWTVSLDGKILTSDERFDLAQRDGFKHAARFLAWFDDVHGMPFDGHVVRW